MAERSIIASIIGTAGAGFRLSLLLNAVGVEMSTSNLEIQAIGKDISLFSLTLKQVGLAMEAAESVASQNAINTAKNIATQSEIILAEIKQMTEVSQKTDEQGHLQSVTVARRVRWCFQKHKVQYLLGQLEFLKLSLLIMLQILQLGKRIATTRNSSSRPFLNQQEMLQERAEIQNMVVVRNWSLVNLGRLYRSAEDEALHPVDSPPLSFEGIAEMDGDPRLSITASAHEDTSKAMVKYQEMPLGQLDESMNKAMYRPNKILHAPINNVVDYLLNEWTRVPGTASRPRHRRHKYDPHYETDTESDSEYEFERSKDIKGRYIEGSKNGVRNVKNVHFRARVESDSEDSDTTKSKRKPPKRHVLRSDDEDSSSVSSDDELSPERDSRRSSASSNASRRQEMHEHSPQSHRPIPPGIPNPNGGGDIQPGRPSSRGGPPSPVQSRPMPILTQSWQGQPQQIPGLRPPQLYNIPPTPHRTGSFSQYMPRQPSYPPPPNPQGRSFYPPSPVPSAPVHSQRSSQRSRHHPRNDRPSERKDRPSDRKERIKKGLIGAGAVAGLMDILEGLSAI